MNAPQLSLLEEVQQKLGALSPDEYKEVVELVVKSTADLKWIPTTGPQADAYYCEADILLYGGSGGSGKSDLIAGLAVTSHKRSLIMRRQYTDLSSIIDRVREIDGSYDGFNGSPPPRLKTADGRLIDFGAAARLGDEEHWQGNPHDGFFVDEVVHFLEAQIRFLMGWVRSSDANQRVRTVLATNPPTGGTGDFIIGMFRPWLDMTHHNPAKPGELRHYVTDPDGKDFEVEGPELYQFPGQDKPVLPKTRTFIPAELADNPFLKDTGYAATLDALPEPLRSAVRDGNFMAARDDDVKQMIPTSWIRAAMRRWTKFSPAGVPMCAMAVDPSAGGKDKTTLAWRHDGWFAPIIEIPGAETPLGKEIAGLVIQNRTDNAVVIIDMGGGYGGVPYTILEDNRIEPVAYKGSEGSNARTADRKLAFYNKRTEIWWKLREALDLSQRGGSGIMLPDDQELLSDLTSVRFDTIQYRGAMTIKAETKLEVVKRLGRSPDCFVGETRISTPLGPVQIKSIRVGDSVKTPFGARKVIAVHRQYCDNVLVAVHRGKELLRGRPSHRIFTWENGWVRLDDVTDRHTLEHDTAWSLMAWRLRDLFFTRDKSIGFKQQVDTIHHRERMMRKDFFTGGFGLTRTGLLIQEFIFTTLMRTGRTTALRIWRRLMHPTTGGCTWKSASKTQSIKPLFCDGWKWGATKQRNGTGQRKEDCGTSITGNALGKTGSPLQRFVKNAAQILMPAWTKPGFAQLAVCSVPQGTILGPFHRYVPSVANRFLQTSINQGKRAPGYAETGLLQGKGAFVYNLTLDFDNVYYANNVLVENCGDAVTMCWSVGNATMLGQIIQKDHRMGGRMPKVITSKSRRKGYR